ncbi:MAG: hypothetical protein F7B60_01905 [Desulfurococcales archaeon]|nr:hypothetical protein [Desulfurococcales archaeon]
MAFRGKFVDRETELSILNKEWKEPRSIDTVLDKTNIVLVLSGPSASFFEKELLRYKAPLHGRRTSQIHLYPMRLLEARRFLA